MIKYCYTLVFLFCLSMSPIKAQLSIQEIMYNNPGEDIYEYIKVWNISGAPLNLAGYRMDAGLEAVFPDVTIETNNWFFVVSDSLAFTELAGSSLPGFEVVQSTGALNNSGETIRILNPNGEAIEEVTYSDRDGWPTFADGNGSSLTYCGTTMQDKNDPDLWNLTPATLGFEVDDQPFYGLIGDIFFQCTERGIASLFSTKISVLEGEGSVFIPLYINRADQEEVNVEITSADGTALSSDDYELITTTIFSDTDTMDTFFVEVMINDDAEQEVGETFTLSFPFFTDEYLSLTSSIEVTIIDNDAPLTEGLILTGVFDAQPGFSGTKGAEFYALSDIPDLSVYGIGIVNNGNGSDGVEFTFPAVSIDEGTFIYLAEDSLEFADFFRFDPDFTTGIININGDDAVQLFENAQPLDVYGEVDMDGTGTVWEYLDGWAYRRNGTTQDFDTFDTDNWIYSGVDALEGAIFNDEANIPFPLKTYSPMAPTMVVANDDSFTFPAGTTSGNLDVTLNDQIPVEINNIEIETPPTDITVTVSADFSIDFTAPQGYSGTDIFSYVIFTAQGVQEAFVTVIIEAPLDFQLLDIAQVTMEDANGVATEIGTTAELVGNVYGVNLSTAGTLFTIIDDNGDGIAVFNNASNLGYTVTEGDVVSVRGTISQFNGLTQISAEEIERTGDGANLLDAREVFVLDENSESNLVEINNLRYVDITQFGGGTSGFNFFVTNGTNEFEIRIDSEVDLFLLPAPGDENSELIIAGIGGQFDTSSPFDEGYQLLPRFASDISVLITSVDNTLGSQLELFPNPASKSLTLTSEEALDEVRITDVMGRNVIQIRNPSQRSEIDVQYLNAGIYTVQCIKDDRTFALKLIVQ